MVVISTAGPAGYDPATGKLNWEHNWKFAANPLRTVASPVLAGDLVLASSGDGKGDRHLVAVRPSQGSSAELAWENTKAFPYVPTLIFDKGKLLGVTDKGFLLVHDAATGKELVNRRLGAGYSASPLLVDGVLITVDEKGSVSCVGTGEGFPVLGKTELGEAVIATPGGIVSDPATFNLLLQHCTTVWLQAAPADHMKRVMAQGDLRPMAASSSSRREAAVTGSSTICSVPPQGRPKLAARSAVTPAGSSPSSRASTSLNRSSVGLGAGAGPHGT